MPFSVPYGFPPEWTADLNFGTMIYSPVTEIPFSPILEEKQAEAAWYETRLQGREGTCRDATIA